MILLITLLIIAGIANAFMDVLKSQWKTSIFKNLKPWHWFYLWAGPGAWRNKWKNGEKSEGNRFFLSSTALVFLTDGWHFFQFIWGTAFTLAIVFYQPINLTHVWIPTWLINFVILKSIYLITFNIFYEKILK